VFGTVSVSVTPNPIPATATTVTASGNVASNSGCRRLRTVRFFWVSGGVPGPEVGTTVTGSNVIPKKVQQAPGSFRSYTCRPLSGQLSIVVPPLQ